MCCISRSLPTTPPRLFQGINGGAVAAERGDLGSPFFALQSSVVLENGVIEPERIESYNATEGYVALHHVLHYRTPAEVTQEITRSGLRGRGGAGSPTGVKWATVAKNKGERKVVVCNADDECRMAREGTCLFIPHSAF